jgi:hypothetical protein
MATKAGTWIERHKPERLGFRGFNDFSNIDPHGIVHDF